MELFRRKFIKQMTVLIVGIPFIANGKKIAKISKLTSKTAKKINVTSAFKIFELPSEPKIGEILYFHVSKESLRFPSKIRYSTHKIAGDKEDFKMDMMANFSLTFQGQKHGWILG